MMFFNHPKVRAYLMAHGEVFTLRDHKRREGRDLLVTGSRFKNARLGFGEVCLVKIFAGLSSKALRPYLNRSGFQKCAEWIEAFKEVHKKSGDGEAFLFYVRLLDEVKP